MVVKRNNQKNRSGNYGCNETGKLSAKDENGAGLVAGRTRGLCKDCENRKICELPIREEGVWHCENYL